jgi:hypothetical protein
MAEIPAGRFEDCYKIDVYTASYGGDYSDYYYYGEYPWYSVWLAQGVGPVKVGVMDYDSKETIGILVLNNYKIAK